MRLMACHQGRRVKARVTLNQLKLLILSPPFEPRRPKSVQPSPVLPKKPRSDVRNMQGSGQKQQLKFSCYCCYYNLNVQHLNQAVQSHYGLLALNIVISEPGDGLQGGGQDYLVCSLVQATCKDEAYGSVKSCCKSYDRWADKYRLFLNLVFLIFLISHNYGLCLSMSLALHQLKE